MRYYKTHGMTGTPEYRTWRGMLDRCFNEKSSAYHRYGGRGITICDRWINSFENFYADMGPRPSDDHSIDRINNDGNYEPSNCRWATVEEQVYNRSTTIFLIDPNTGEEINSKEAMELYGLKKGTLFTRLNRGKDLNAPIRNKVNTHIYQGKEYTTTELAAIANIPMKIMSSRLGQGFTPEEAVTRPIEYDPVYPYKHTQFTVRDFSDYTNISDFNIRYNLRNGKTLEEIEILCNDYNKTYPYKGKEYTITELAKLFNTTHSTVNVRIRRGETPEEIEQAIFNTKNPTKYEYQGQMLTVVELAKLTGYDTHGFRRHLGRGKTAEEAIALIKKNSGAHLYLVEDKEMTIYEIAEMLQVKHTAIRKHLGKGRTMDEAITRIKNYKLVRP